MLKRPKTPKYRKRLRPSSLDCGQSGLVQYVVILFFVVWSFFLVATFRYVTLLPAGTHNVPIPGVPQQDIAVTDLVDSDTLILIKNNAKNLNMPPEEVEVLSKLRYWKSTGRQMQPTNKFLFFDVDCGGFNNIRIAFELYVVIAWLTDRTLVLPPDRGWYLLDFGPQTRMKSSDQSGTSSFADYFDIEDMKRALPVMTMQDFIDKHGKEFNLDPKFSKKIQGKATNTEWIRWKSANWGEFAPAWDPYNNAIFWPDISSVKDIDHVKLDNRNKVEISEKLKNSQFFDFASCKGKGYRYLGNVANWIQYADRHKMLQQYILVRDNMHYVDAVFEIAAKVIAFLGMFKYSSFHIRRNELQYKENFISAETSFENTNVLLNQGEKLYIATDETSPTFFDFLEKKHPVYRWHDFFEERGGFALKDVEIPRKLIGCIEQVICAAGRHFFGTKASTFSAYIFRLRGYIEAPDNDQLYLHVRKYTGDPGHDSQRPYGYSAREYMMEFPYLWQMVQDL